MTKKIQIFLVSILTINAYAETTNLSPYSGYGLGDIRNSGGIEISSMGGASTAYISDFGSEINFNNPAANKNLTTTSFSVGIDTDILTQKTDLGKDTRSITHITNLSLAIPLSTKSKAGISLNPFSTLGYKTKATSTIGEEEQNVTMNGKGGLNQITGFYSLQVSPKIGLGARIDYVFGNLDRLSEFTSSSAPLISGTYNSHYFSFFRPGLGTTYETEVKEGHFLTLGATYTFPVKTSADAEYLESTYYYDMYGEKKNEDTISSFKGDQRIKIPGSFSLGASYKKEYKWGVGIDFKYTNLSKLNMVQENVTYDNSYRMALGGWFIPNANSTRSYMKRVTYRYGAYYEKTGLVINDKNIDAYGLTLGAGLPIGKRGTLSPSMLNLGLEVGQKGTMKNNLSKETFVNLRIGLNFNDSWFKRRKYD